MFQMHPLPNLRQQDKKISSCKGCQYVKFFKIDFRMLRVDSKSGWAIRLRTEDLKNHCVIKINIIS